MPLPWSAVESWNSPAGHFPLQAVFASLGHVFPKWCCFMDPVLGLLVKFFLTRVTEKRLLFEAGKDASAMLQIWEPCANKHALGNPQHNTGEHSFGGRHKNCVGRGLKTSVA
jgi:hypothetical protein